LLDSQSKVFHESNRGSLRDGDAAARKLEALRQACSHPQVSSQSFLGNQVLTMTEIASRMTKRAQVPSVVQGFGSSFAELHSALHLLICRTNWPKVSVSYVVS
jgi:hypothetical protein